jgi:2'-5' RNA ligase
MAGTATQAPEKTAPKDAAPKGDTQKDGGASAPTAPATDGQGDGSGLTLADLPHLAVAAPGATPDGAAHYLTDEAKTAEAWLAPGENGQDAGFIRSAASPDRAVRVDDVQSWAQIVDSMGLRETDPNAGTEGDAADAQAPAAADGQDDAHAAPSGAKAPAPKGPETGKKELSGEPEDTEGKAAAAGQVVTPDDHEEQTGIMVALIVPEGDAADIMLTDFPTALPASELHLTLAYLGKTEEVDDEGAYYANVLEALRDVAAQHDTLNGVVSGVGRFSIPGDADAFYYSFDAPELPELRHDLVTALEEAGIDVNRDHGFTPHITICYLKEGEESPIRRAESKVLAFENLTFCYGDQRLNIRLGGTDPEEADAEFEMEAGRPGQVDSTAPSAMPDGKAKPNPFTKKGGAPVATGAWVAWGDQRGRVDLVVTNGKVPGVEQDVTGSKDKPAARVVVYEQGAGGKWKSTGRKVGVSASSLKRSFPLSGGGAFGKKDLDFADPEAALVELHAAYFESVGALIGSDLSAKGHPLVDARAVQAVYERGLASWPGSHCGVPNEAWALGRTKAFLAVAAGAEVPGYVADRDLLPEGHPLAVKAAPAFVIDTPAVVIDEADGNTTTGGAEVVVVPDEVPEQESKVAGQIAGGEHLLDATVINDTLAALRKLLG